MGWVESFLIGAGDFARSAATAIADGAASLFGALDAILNPVLSPVLSVLNPVCTFLGDITYAMLGWLPGWLSLTIVSSALGLIMLVAFRYTSNQVQIARAKDGIKANLLALKLYKDDLLVTFKTQGRLLWAVARLQRYILTPVAIMAFPMLLLLAQMAARHQWRPLAEGETALVRVKPDNAAAAPSDLRLESGGGVAVEVGPLRGQGDIVWRIRGIEPGRHQLTVKAGGQTYAKEVVVGPPLSRVSALRPGKEWTAQLLYPIEPVVPPSGFLREILIEYPPLPHWYYGSDWWMVSVLAVSMLVGFVFRSAFGVTF